MKRNNPRIQAQQNLLHELLSIEPDLSKYDAGDAEWRKSGIELKASSHALSGWDYYREQLVNKLEELNEEERRWYENN